MTRGDRILHAKGCREVLEDPLSGAGKPVEGLLDFEVPVEEIAGVGLGPVAIAGDASLAAGLEIGHAAFIGAMAGGDLGERLIRVFGMATRVAVGSPLGMEEMLDAFALSLNRLLILGVRPAVPTGPDGGE